MASPLIDLHTALVAVDDAVAECLALAWSSEPTGDERRHAAQRAVDAYERTDRTAGLILEAIIGDGGARGLDDALAAAHQRATERLTCVYALRAASDGPEGTRAVIVAEHAATAALARLARAQIVARAWIAKRLEAA